MELPNWAVGVDVALAALGGTQQKADRSADEGCRVMDGRGT